MPGDRVIWNGGIPFKEIDGPPGKAVFASYRRTESLALLAGAALFGGLSWIMLSVLESIFFTAFAGLVSGILVGLAIFHVWTKRVLVVDRDRREIALVRTCPWRVRRTAYPFSSLQSVSIEEVEDSDVDRAGWLALVLVNIAGGPQLVPAQTHRDPALAFARRLAALTEVPLGPPIPGSRPS